MAQQTEVFDTILSNVTTGKKTKITYEFRVLHTYKGQDTSSCVYLAMPLGKQLV